MKNSIVVAAGFLAFAALSAFATPITFSECPSVGLNAGCELLITITQRSNTGVATAFTVSTSVSDPGSYDSGGDGTLIGVLNSTGGGVNSLSVTIAPGTGSLDFDLHGACAKSGGVPLYTPTPAASQCLGGAYWTTDAMDYASVNVTFPTLNSNDLADLVINFNNSSLGPGQSDWFSLPGSLTAGEFSIVTPEPGGVGSRWGRAQRSLFRAPQARCSLILDSSSDTIGGRGIDRIVDDSSPGGPPHITSETGH